MLNSEYGDFLTFSKTQIVTHMRRLVQLPLHTEIGLDTTDERARGL